MPNVKPMMAEVPVAKPSRPSVKFAPFETAVTTKTVASCAGVEDRRSLLDCLHHACSHYDSDAENAIERVLKWKRKKEL